MWACLLFGLLAGVGLIGLAAKLISGVVYRHLLRTGSADPAIGQIISFIASFIGIVAIVLIGGYVFLSSFRFER